MIIAFSGPAGAGKGTLASMLANYLRLPHYDFGLLYRAIAYANLQVQYLKVEDGKILFQGSDITESLRTEEIGLRAAKMIRDLKDLAISMIGHTDFICDGRTCGTEIYPNADFKFYITANQKERFERRSQDGGNREMMLEREKLDEARLKVPFGAIVIDTTGKPKEVSFAEILSYLW